MKSKEQKHKEAIDRARISYWVHTNRKKSLDEYLDIFRSKEERSDAEYQRTRIESAPIPDPLSGSEWNCRCAVIPHSSH